MHNYTIFPTDQPVRLQNVTGDSLEMRRGLLVSL